MSKNGIGSLERGDRLAPQRETIALLAQALGLSPADRVRFEAAAARPSHPRSRDIAVPPAESARQRLPLSLTSFIGREQECAEISRLVLESRLVTLTGPGGIGKSRTALEVARAAGDAASGDVKLVELAPVADPSLVGTTIARALEIREPSNATATAAIVALLKAKSLLLILDNCEHVIDEVRVVASAIVSDCPEVTVLATSREPLNVSGERAYRLASLQVPPPGNTLTAETARAYSAVALFVDRALASDARFSVTDQNAPILADIARRLDGIPLAIELAAAKVKVLAPHQLVQRLDERFRLLTGGDRTKLPRHQTMRALIDWSYDLLSDAERRLFRGLSIFAGGFTLETANAVMETDVLDVLSSLVDKSLVQPDFTGDETRYALLESTRQYAAEKLIENGEAELVARAHARAYLELAERLDRAAPTTPDRELYAQSEPELQNWRAALEWALAGKGDVVLGERLVGALSVVWWDLPSEEGQRWVRVALAAAEESHPPAVLAKLDLTAAQLEAVVHQYQSSYDSAQRALGRYRDLDDALGIAHAQRISGRALLYLSRVAEGVAFLESALASYRTLGYRRGIAQVLHGLGNAADMSGDFEQGRRHLAAAAALFEETGAAGAAAAMLVDLAEAEFHAGDALAALGLLENALALNRANPRGSFIWRTLSNRSAYLVAVGRFDEATADAREALVLARDAQHETTAAFAIQHVAAATALRPAENAERARDDCSRAARLLGFVEQRLTDLGPLREITERREAERLLAALRDTLGPGDVDRMMNEGRSWSESRAVAEALSANPPPH